MPGFPSEYKQTALIGKLVKKLTLLEPLTDFFENQIKNKAFSQRQGIDISEAFNFEFQEDSSKPKVLLQILNANLFAGMEFRYCCL